MRLKPETDRSIGKGREENQEGGARVVFGGTRSPDLPHFIDGKDDLDSYLLRFERYATFANWPQANWATQLSALLGGKILDVYSRLSQEDSLDYKRLKGALLQRYNYTEQGYRQRFRKAQPESAENHDQFIVSLRNYFTQWMKLSKVESSFEGVVELMVKEQFINSCSKEISVHLIKWKPQRKCGSNCGTILNGAQQEGVQSRFQFLEKC